MSAALVIGLAIVAGSAFLALYAGAVVALIATLDWLEGVSRRKDA